jgi:hypothetical protein
MSVKSQIKKFFEPCISRILPSYVTFDQNRNDRAGALFKAWGLVITSRIQGGYYEFGVYKGESFRESYRIYRGYAGWCKGQAHSAETWRRQIEWKCAHGFYAFDTFAGMPENNENNPVFAKGTFCGSLEEVKSAGERMGMMEGEHIKYFKGLFADVARSQAQKIRELQPAAIVNIDSDLYVSAMDALEIVRPKLQQGTVLLMDDWNTFCADRNQGERRALREFLEKYSQMEVESWFPYSHTGQAFIVHLRNDRSLP